MIQDAQPINILLVDDHSENLLALEAILGDLGENLVKMTSGKDALRYLLDHDVAVILLDVRMPDMDGYETAALIRERERLQHTPIIFLTANTSNETNIFKGYSLGAVDYLFKPFQPEVLRAKVNVFIDLYRKTTEVERQAELLRDKNKELGKTNKAIAGLYQELENKTVELYKERDFIDAILETAGSIVIVYNEDGEVELFNHASQILSGYSIEEVKGKKIWDILIPEEDRQTAIDTFERAKFAGNPLTIEYCWRTRTGSTRRIAWSTTSLVESDPARSYVIGTGIDITDRHTAENKIKQLNEDLERRVLARTSELQAKNEELKSEIAERKRIEEALRESESRFRRLVESNLIGVYFADLEGTIIHANDAFLDIAGVSRTDLIEKGISWSKLVAPEYADVEQAAFQQLHATGVCTPYEKEYVRSDGSRVPVLVGKAMLEGSQNILVAFVLDLTERKKSEAELKQAKETAERANSAKDQFLAVLSHELRTPLTPVLAIVQMLEEDENVHEEIRPWVQTIRRNVELEARLIDDLLDLTRVANSKLQLNVETVDLHEIIGRVIEICQPEIATKKLHVKSEFKARHFKTEGDPARLQQVLWNLVKNAVKFTPEGGEIRIGTTNHRAGTVTVEVTDTGIGIRPELQSKIFDAFEQGDTNMTRQFGGLGLGLAISKALVDAHAGSIGVHSDGQNLGATFTLELKVIQASSMKKAPLPSRQLRATNGKANRRILIVEDNIDTSHAMKHLLERRGYEVRLATNVGDALELSRDFACDLVISDIGLPDGTGLDVIRGINAVRPTRGIALSGFGMEDDIRKSLAAGFHAHLVKPVNFDHLFEVIDSLLNETVAAEQFASPN